MKRNSPAKVRSRLLKLYGDNGAPLVKSFLPKGRSGLYIYAVSLHAHPDKVKIGMTRNWKARRKSYASWNLSSSDAISSERIFCITEEFIDLEKLEACILKNAPFPLVYGAEWFHGQIEDVARYIDRIMCEHNISYDFFSQ